MRQKDIIFQLALRGVQRHFLRSVLAALGDCDRCRGHSHHGG